MKAANVIVGKSYWAKVTGKVVSVRITSTSQYGGWNGVNNETGREVRVKTAARLRGPVNGDEGKPKPYDDLPSDDDSVETFPGTNKATAGGPRIKVAGGPVKPDPRKPSPYLTDDNKTAVAANLAKLIDGYHRDRGE